MTHDPIAFVGGGNMARSLVGGLVARGTPGAAIRIAEPVDALREALARDFGASVFPDGAAAVAGASTWVFAVKPQVMRAACESLAPQASTRVPTYNDWKFVRDFAALYHRNGWGRLNALLDAHFGEGPEVHHVGGHPEFVQDDWRMARPEYRKADRVLLNLWSDKTLMWGDAGQGQFLIARDDLRKRDFAKVWYQWDCS